MAVPGLAQPGKDGTGTSQPWLYIGHAPVTYLDYLDASTGRTLSAYPGNWYSMVPANSRAGLTVPPPDSCWLTAANKFAPRFVFFRPPVPEPQPPPEVLALDALYEPADALARARIRNANLQAFLAQGGRLGGH
jgi:hypothetical protein